jgi:hypothetical protein
MSDNTETDTEVEALRLSKLNLVSGGAGRAGDPAALKAAKAKMNGSDGQYTGVKFDKKSGGYLLHDGEMGNWIPASDA